MQIYSIKFKKTKNMLKNVKKLFNNFLIKTSVESLFYCNIVYENKGKPIYISY